MIHDPRCKLNMMARCLENYYSFLELEVDVPSLVSYIKSTFYLLYDEYFKLYGQNININVQQDVPQAKPPSTQFGKGY